MREKKYEEIVAFCKEHNVNFISIRNIQSSGKTRIKVSVFCSECGARFDVTADTLRRQKFPGLCTKCAHKHSADFKRFCAQDIVDRFEANGYTVLTPVDKIKPVGKNKSYNRSIVEIQDKHGVIHKICWNNFSQRIEQFRALNDDGYSAVGHRELSSLEKMVAEYLDNLGIPYKREFKFSNCRGDKRMLPFDFCLNYADNNKMLIEVDGARHYKEYFAQLHKYDKIKDYFCASNNVPLLRIPYWEFDEQETYKHRIDSFINTNCGSDTI